MNEKAKKPIELMAELLAAMTERAMEAEHERNISREDAAQWYQLYQNGNAKLKEAVDKLAKEIEAHKNTQQTLLDAVEALERMNARTAPSDSTSRVNAVDECANVAKAYEQGGVSHA